MESHSIDQPFVAYTYMGQLSKKLTSSGFELKNPNEEGVHSQLGPESVLIFDVF